MKRVAKPVFFVIAILILVLSYFATFGLHTQYGDIDTTVIKGIGDIRWGIDIRGGVEATFKPADGVDATDEEIETAKAIIETRLVSNNITDYELYADASSDRIIVRFPWKEDETEFDAKSAIEEISATAQLTFRPGNSSASTEYNEDGEIVYVTPTGDTAETILMDGSNVESAQAGVNGTEYVVSLKLKDASIFESITTQYNGQTVSIWLDDEMISAPTVQAVITDGQASITGLSSAEEAQDLATKINAGALPFGLETTSFGAVDPTLGESALVAMAYAAVVALIFMAIFLIVMYRLPGFIAVIALLGQLALSVAAISGLFTAIPSFTMTLPGIAGMILSIGMGADANIITAERIREELRAGKTIDGAVMAGTKGSFWAIFDGNITVIIVAIILLLVFGPVNILAGIFGPSTTGTIYSFGYTLLVGVISNFIMGVGASRLMIKSVSGIKFLRKKWLFGGAGK
ncbi:MAG: SecD/SecF family protein translocase subunit [Acutalibacteraceae bacterium]|nr:SecD/SecF family protein translocase subunit [Acutalibacteraceae bacterium]